MGVFIFVLKWISFFILFIFAVICLATGLYYLSELIEEYERTIKKWMRYTILIVVGIHFLLFIFEGLPFFLSISWNYNASYLSSYVTSLPKYSNYRHIFPC